MEEKNSLQGYDGFHTVDADEFERYKSELIEEAMNEGPGFTWNEVKKQLFYKSIALSETGLWLFTSRNI